MHSHLETLEKNGYIRRDPTKPRAIEICDDSFQMVRTEMVSLPVIGNVAAGQPILAEENIQDYFPVPADVVPKGESFILNVRGESMINAGIFNGIESWICSTNIQNEGFSLGNYIGGNGEVVLNILLSEDRLSGSNIADDREAYHLGTYHLETVITDFNGTGLGRVSADVAVLLQSL